MTGKELKAIRKHEGLTQRQLSELLFYSVEAVKHWEKGRYAVPTGMREQLIRMGVKVDAILHRIRTDAILSGED